MVIMNTTRTHYSKKEAANDSLTVGELINILKGFNPNAPIIYSNDNGYTYGTIDEYHVYEIEVVDKEEEDD